MLHLATSVARSNLISLGTCFGKFSKTGKFKLGITSLDWLAKYAKYKVCPQAVRAWPFRPSALQYTGGGKLTVGMG
jgi:60S ribosome subunit biogenesis protein NIP7